MRTYDVRAHSAADPATVYQALLDGLSWPKWLHVDSFELESGGSTDAPQGLGAIRVFRTGRNVSREQIVELTPDQHMAYVILPGNFLRDYRGDIDLALNPSGGTDIRWRGVYNMPIFGIGWLFEQYLRRFQQRGVNGLAAYTTELAQTSVGIGRENKAASNRATRKGRL